jgi:chromate reductase
MRPSLLGISGSLRRESFNSKLMREAARLFGDADFTEADLNLPLYNADVEYGTGIPSAVQALSDQIKAAEIELLAVNPKKKKKGDDKNGGDTGTAD